MTDDNRKSGALYIAHAIKTVGILAVAAFMWHHGYRDGGGWLFVLGVLMAL